MIKLDTSIRNAISLVDYQKFQVNPFVFFKKEEDKENKSYWVCKSPTPADWKFDERCFYSPNNLWVLAKVRTQCIPGQGGISYYVNTIQELNPKWVPDWVSLVMVCFSRSQNKYDPYYYKELLWFLNWHDWNEDTLQRMFSQLSPNLKIFFLKEIQEIGCCLSIEKQKKIQKLFSNYQIWNPEILHSQLDFLSYSQKTDLNIFNQIKEIIAKCIEWGINHGGDKSNDDRKQKAHLLESGNLIVTLYRWLWQDLPFQYDTLQRLIPFFDSDLLLRILRKYFFDIKRNKTTLDENLLKEFKTSHYKQFSQFSHCINSPEDECDLTIPILADSILTCKKTNGEKLQTYNGVLDIAFANADVYNPLINCSLQRILPTCNGLVPSDVFNGFVKYDYVYEVDTNHIDDERLLETAKRILNNFCKESYRYYINSQGEKIILEANGNDNTTEQVYSSYYDDRWRCSKDIFIRHKDNNGEPIITDKLQLLNFFIRDFSEREDDSDIHLTLESIDTSVFRSSIEKFVSKQTKQSGGFILDKTTYRIILEYLIPLFTIKCIIIQVNETCFVSNKWDVFDLFGGDKAKQEIFNKGADGIAESESARKESQIIKQRVVKSLVEMFKDDGLIEQIDINGRQCFEIRYSPSALDKLHVLFCGEPISNDDSPEGVYFLEKITGRKYDIYCAPKYENKINSVIQLPFFWCLGNNCYRNSLEEHLVDNSNWSNYTILEMLEILGFPQLKKLSNGCEADPRIREFIRWISKAKRMFTHFKCRQCGHILHPTNFANDTKDFNIYNRFHCIDPNCSCSHSDSDIYISHCHSCSSGIIDSRDTTQCPNGWYICPQCLSCCNDSGIDRQVQKYIKKGIPVPSKLENQRGHGHNDHHLYYCPRCRCQLFPSNSSQKDTSWDCPNHHGPFVKSPRHF